MIRSRKGPQTLHGRPRKRSWTPEQLESDKSESVAIIGGGPGGLTAALRLAQLGYRCTIYEALPRLGGMMRYGIPDYRLPKSVLDNEIGSILRVGKVEVKRIPHSEEM